MENQTEVLFYGGGWNCFSNMSSYMVEIDNVLFPTSEHAYQWFKFTDPKIKDEILHTRSGYEAKMVANKYRDSVRSDWKDISIKIMTMILKSKLDQHPHILKKLKDTRDMKIVENSPDDYFWGIGKDGTGQNAHGKIWMELREEYC